jgi:hypothetical protein
MAIFDARERVFTGHRTRGERTSLNVGTFISLGMKNLYFLVVSERIPFFTPAPD